MDLKMIVLFTEWCPKCNMMMPIVDEVEQYYRGKLQVLRIDADQNPEAMVYYEAEVVPTFVLYRGKIEVGRMAGMLGEKVIYQRIDEIFVEASQK